MGVGRYIGRGMTVGWHSFTPNERVVAYPFVTAIKLANRIAERERQEQSRQIRGRVARRPK